ncbi:MAG: hypothetical protein H0T73_05585 [Ardenticatenales bacterium]|nr:hypothetical protein [Ardenticatenales bacterium]
MTTYQETPLYEQAPMQEAVCSETTLNKGHLLVGMGAFFLFAQIIPGNIFFPLALMVLGVYLRRQQKGASQEHKLTKGHFFVGLGAFFLMGQVIPGNLFVPLLLIAGGIYFLRQQGKATAR